MVPGQDSWNASGSPSDGACCGAAQPMATNIQQERVVSSFCRVMRPPQSNMERTGSADHPYRRASVCDVSKKGAVDRDDLPVFFVQMSIPLEFFGTSVLWLRPGPTPGQVHVPQAVVFVVPRCARRLRRRQVGRGLGSTGIFARLR